MNQQIRVPQVRLIDFDGALLGVRPINEALSLAQERGQDLVEIAPQAVPPVCKIIEFSKYIYELDKKAHEARKKHKVIHLKEVRIRPRISEHDLATKINHAREFLANRDKVRVVIVYHGREMQHRDLGMALADKVKAALADIADVESNAFMMGTRLYLTLAPKQIQKK